MNPVIRWKNIPENREDVERRVMEDMRENLPHLFQKQNFSDLIFHTVFLGETMDGPGVIVFGIDGDAMAVEAIYEETPESIEEAPNGGVDGKDVET